MQKSFVYVFVIFCLFSFDFVSVCANRVESTTAILPEVVRSQVFTRLRVLKEPSAVQVVDGKAIKMHVEQQDKTYSIELLFHLTMCFLTFSSSFECFPISYYVWASMQIFSAL